MRFTYYLLFAFTLIVFVRCSSDDDSEAAPMNQEPTTTLSSDLELSLAVSDSIPEVNSDITFTILVKNNALDTATDIVIENILPNGYTYLDDDGGSSYSQDNGQWTIPSLDSNNSESLNISVTVNDSGDYTYVAEIVACSNHDPDSTPNNGILSEDDQDDITINPLGPSTVNVSTLVVLNAADALALDSQACIIYASSYALSRVYTVAFDGTFSTFLTGQPGAAGVAFDADENLYLARYEADDIVKRDPATGDIEVFTNTANPIALHFDSNENLYVNNNFTNFITKVDPSGNNTSIGISILNNSSVALDDADNVYVSDYNSGTILKIDAVTNVQSVFSTIPITTGGIGYIIYSNGYFYATAIAEGTVYQIDGDGNAEIIAGIPGVSGTTDGDGNTATFDRPIGIVASEDGNTLYVAQNGGAGAIRIITGYND